MPFEATSMHARVVNPGGFSLWHRLYAHACIHAHVHGGSLPYHNANMDAGGAGLQKPRQLKNPKPRVMLMPATAVLRTL